MRRHFELSGKIPPHFLATLFWGVRGGGGNFGIVTGFEFQLHPMQRQVIGGAILFPIARARDVLTVAAEYMPRAPDELDLIPLVILPPGGEPGLAGFGVCHSGPANQADRALAPLRRLGTPVVDVGPIDYVALQRSGDISDPRARATYIKSGFLPRLTPELVTILAEGLQGHPTRMTQMFIQPAGGAIARVANNATAFSHRDAFGNMGVSVDWKSGDDGARHMAWTRQLWSRIEPFTRGFYSNDGDPEAYTPGSIQSNFRGNYDRMVDVKTRFDPTNLFRLNPNVAPRQAGGR
jgi:FAD/FMN-containing dehydrogenase